MCDLAKILEIMERVRQQLRSIEKITQQMITCPSERLVTLMIQRNDLMDALEKADREMKELCKGQEDGPAVLDAAVGKGEINQLSGAMLEIYQAGQGHRAIFSRLREGEMQAVLRLKQEQLEILEKIKSTNQGGAAKASRFFSVGSAGGGFNRLGKA